MGTGDSDPDEGSLNGEAERGTAKVFFSVPGSRPNELCALPMYLPFAKYRGKDGQKDSDDEKRLAHYDFYKTGNAESGASRLQLLAATAC
ncbi:MAG: hypothetical protein ABI883_04805 [Chthoniobacterales bacterium]